MTNIWRHVRILPLLILVSMLTFVVRVGDFVAGFNHSGAAYAQSEVKGATPPPMPTSAAAPTPAKPAPAPVAALPATPPAVPAAPTVDTGKPVTPPDDADVKDAIYKDLAQRRLQLDQREKSLNAREALLKASEAEINQKLVQLTQIRTEIQGLMKQQDDAEKARIDSLTKMYEGMKPDDAARIFNTLDMDLLVKIIGNMSERKSGPVLAAMTPERAKTVTQMLAQQKQLPAVPAP